MNAPTKMNCRTLVELVTDYLEGALGDAERTAVEAHLAQCDGCTNYLEQIRTTIRVTGHLHEEQIPAEAREPLLRVFRDWTAER
ncbi:MAG TPA: zf-HC2 domain-containing protein [Actinomycetota bacterium]|nr:zf-HC2 domain-containing protein [Actinomycetota bacterium]